MPAIRLALDWTPNTNHTGFYVAKAKGKNRAPHARHQMHVAYPRSGDDTPHCPTHRVYTCAGWYSDRGLDVTFLSPHSDGYKTTPAQRLSSGEADLAVTPTETIISSATQPAHSDKPRLKVRGSTHRACFKASTSVLEARDFSCLTISLLLLLSCCGQMNG